MAHVTHELLAELLHALGNQSVLEVCVVIDFHGTTEQMTMVVQLGKVSEVLEWTVQLGHWQVSE
jgi:hypothetical protein